MTAENIRNMDDFDYADPDPKLNNWNRIFRTKFNDVHEKVKMIVSDQEAEMDAALAQFGLTSSRKSRDATCNGTIQNGDFIFAAPMGMPKKRAVPDANKTYNTRKTNLCTDENDFTPPRLTKVRRTTNHKPLDNVDNTLKAVEECGLRRSSRHINKLVMNGDTSKVLIPEKVEKDVNVDKEMKVQKQIKVDKDVKGVNESVLKMDESLFKAFFKDNVQGSSTPTTTPPNVATNVENPPEKMEVDEVPIVDAKKADVCETMEGLNISGRKSMTPSKIPVAVSGQERRSSPAAMLGVTFVYNKLLANGSPKTPSKLFSPSSIPVKERVQAFERICTPMASSPRIGSFAMPKQTATRVIKMDEDCCKPSSTTNTTRILRNQAMAEATKKQEEERKQRVEEMKRKREEKSKKVAATREAVEREKMEKLMQEEREKEEKARALLKEREERMLEEAKKKKAQHEQKKAEMEERRRMEEAARQARARDIEALKLKEAEEAKLKLKKQQMEEARALAKQHTEEKLKVRRMESLKMKKLKETMAAAAKKNKETYEDYGYADMDEKDSSEDEQKPKKPLPKWGLKENRAPYLQAHYYLMRERINIWFHRENQKHPTMDELFYSGVHRQKRTSSAVWNSSISIADESFSK